MTRRFNLFPFLLAIFFLGLTMFAINFKARSEGQVIADMSREARVCFKEKCFQVELASTLAEQTRGLMFREYLEEDCGMLFVYTDDAVRTFWMKNTYIPLDIIWLDSGKEVVYIARNVQPCGVGDCPSIDPGVAARYVLEVDAGEAQKMNLQVGNEFSLVF